jgi:hypothetical protein
MTGFIGSILDFCFDINDDKMWYSELVICMMNVAECEWGMSKPELS